MSKYRHQLPQLGQDFFLMDGGLETTLIFHHGVDLPEFASFPLLRTAVGREMLNGYYRKYLEIAQQVQANFILDSVTWRANSDWGSRLGYDSEALAEINCAAIAHIETLRHEYESDHTQIVLSGCIGPRGDGYAIESTMDATEAEAYHWPQIHTVAGTAADMVCAFTINYPEEAIGIVRAAQRAQIPISISFTLETDGHLPNGQSLPSAVQQVDAATAEYASYFMINCAHPTHFEKSLMGGEPELGRIRGVRANSSRKSHQELNDSTELDSGNPTELGQYYIAIKQQLQQLNIMGGCCGTDHRHIAQIAKECAPLFTNTLTA
ncbi:homocysteine S-methyltransferase family protein [Candidatus Synechococcus calcipolaris G9]|uniref:Homocysteine S-methyltransferase family protein n=1 Tax=Candidatus Synechococcus calcipolaris G9 TaxID=1497997 RepID=A0ABT6EZ89_9SYNE|nr:homocysteine S-methyltransferase family protein [Candidatus Synechococcus calcipolaris]MDG2990903.1 homocysteine S-methyltransferase family protein [Candidatus Synechococcus calcipolaris G9]